MVNRWIEEDRKFICSALGSDGQSILKKQQKEYGEETLGARVEFLNTLIDLVIWVIYFSLSNFTEMIDDFTLEQCRNDREILQLKIKNLEHGINEAEKMIAESQMNDKALTFLRRKVAESNQDLAVLYLIS